MRRREFIAGASAATMLQRAAAAQSASRLPRLGILMNFSERDDPVSDYVPAFLQRLTALGWENGRTIALDLHYTDGNTARWHAAVEQLVATSPDIILTTTGVVVKEFKSRTQTIPIVFVLAGDPIGQGLVASLAHPGGNITGFSNFDLSIGGKWIELLREVAPRVKHISYIYDAIALPFIPLEFPASLQEKLRSAGIELKPLAVQEPAALAAAIAELARAPDSGVIVTPGPFTAVHRDLTIDAITDLGIPAIYGYDFFVDAGGLIAYGVDEKVQFAGAADYVDRILRGTRPADLPVQAARKFDLAINLKTAKRLGLNIPSGLIAGADKVIE